MNFISTLDHDPAGPLSLQPECRQAGAEPQLDRADQRADSGEADQPGEGSGPENRPGVGGQSDQASRTARRP